MVINEVWGTLIKMKLPLVEKLCLLKENMKPLTKHHHPKRHHCAHTIRKLDTLNLDSTLGS